MSSSLILECSSDLFFVPCQLLYIASNCAERGTFSWASVGLPYVGDLFRIVCQSTLKTFDLISNSCFCRLQLLDLIVCVQFLLL
mmetsp:Transcript_7047/g.17839  ORF Transcript_7047/g.17839 Transcript_7047/m.17839 type:complete len:84 (+) Transcript_7047:562-813(+)